MITFYHPFNLDIQQSTAAAPAPAPAAAEAAAAGLPAATGRRDTLRNAADATWRPEITYGRFRVTIATRGCFCCIN